jgi:hypothetical protein
MELFGVQAHGDPLRGDLLLHGGGDGACESVGRLEAARIHLSDAGELGQPEHTASRWHIANM